MLSVFLAILCTSIPLVGGLPVISIKSARQHLLTQTIYWVQHDIYILSVGHNRCRILSIRIQNGSTN